MLADGVLGYCSLYLQCGITTDSTRRRRGCVVNMESLMITRVDSGITVMTVRCSDILSSLSQASDSLWAVILKLRGPTVVTSLFFSFFCTSQEIVKAPFFVPFA